MEPESAPPRRSLLTVRDLTVDYGGGAVVRSVDLLVRSGEILTLLGPNGAGKTSTLNAIFGLAPRTGGTVMIGDDEMKPLAGERSAKHGLVLVPDDRGLFAPMNVWDHLWLGAHGRPSPEQVDRIFTLFPILADRRSQSAGSLSGGEAQMLSIAVALLADPTVLLIDELSFGLAPLIVDQLLELCRRLADEDGLAILLVEQFVDLALAIADRMAVMVGGRFVLEGAAADFTDRREEIQSAYMGAGSMGTGSVAP